MKKEELEQYRHITQLFEKECERVAEFVLGDEKIIWEGDEYWAFGGHERHIGEFPTYYLLMSEDELRDIAKKENETYLEQLRKAEEKKKREQEEADYKQYKKLKEKFGN